MSRSTELNHKREQSRSLPELEPEESAGPLDDSADESAGESSDAQGDSGQRSDTQPVSAGQDQPEETASGSIGAGASTGGFETMLGKLAVDSGLVTPDELELCTSLLEQSSEESSDKARTLADLMLENEFVTRRQLDRLRNEFEAKKSSRRIPGFKIKKKIGSGAMATVFLAHQISLDRPVAIKVLPKKFSANENFIERFYKEGQAAAKLNHPNIVQAYDVGRAGEHHYFVMEYVDGETVYDELVKHKRISEKKAIDIVQQVAKALQHAHAKGFIHRDIKPKNIMITRERAVKLADLGLARAVSDKDAAQAEAGRAYGTPYYISPEQIRGSVKIGAQADIYGLGATFYHMVTGRVPYDGKNPSEVMHKHLKQELTPPDHLNPKISSGCARVIEMMMAKDPADRYQSADDLLYDLNLISKGEAPHFARDLLDVASLNIEPPPQPVPPAENKAMLSGTAFDSPITMTLLVFLLLSLLANAITIALLITG